MMSPQEVGEKPFTSVTASGDCGCPQWPERPDSIESALYRRCRIYAVTQNPLRAGLVPLHILYHAVREEIYGQAMIDELRRHGYKVGPGTLYPLLHRLEERGYLRVREERNGRVMRRHYRATPKGRAALQAVLPQVRELFEELIEHRAPRRRRK
jgi:DNA-binding PadR family transcriptional regulator